MYNRLAECLEETEIVKDALMKNYTSFKVGGKAKLLVFPRSVGELIFTISVCKSFDTPYYIIGNGTNLIVKDKGYNGVIIQLAEHFNEITINDNCVTAQAGALMSSIASQALEYSLSGLEFASGIPGTIGGAVVMNAGAYGGEMSQITEKVTALDHLENIVTFSKKDLNFSYRNSIFQKKQYTLLEIELMLTKKDHLSIKNKMNELKEKRTSKQPLNYPSAGSVFKRPEGYYAGKLIEDAGLKGLSVGDAKVSPRHAGFIINEGNASSADIINLIALIQNTVYEKYNVKLKPEVKILGDD